MTAKTLKSFPGEKMKPEMAAEPGAEAENK